MLSLVVHPDRLDSGQNEDYRVVSEIEPESHRNAYWKPSEQ